MVIWYISIIKRGMNMNNLRNWNKIMNDAELLKNYLIERFGGRDLTHQGYMSLRKLSKKLAIMTGDNSEDIIEMVMHA